MGRPGLTRWGLAGGIGAALLGALFIIGCGGNTRGRGSGGSSPPALDAGRADAATPGPTTPADGGTVSPEPEPPRQQDSCDGFDDDRDGRVDEDCGCEEGVVQTCFADTAASAQVHACAFGTQACVLNGEFPEWAACEGAIYCDPVEDRFAYGEEEVRRPVDVVWVVDQSGSMAEEIANVRANLNSFASTIAGSGIDYHVILMANRGTGGYDICIAPPLGGPACADTERFTHLSVYVSSTDALSLVQSHISSIEAAMRPGSLRVFIVVTDDNSYLGAAAFDSWLTARPGYDDYLFHGVIGESYEVCSGTAVPGTVYMQLAEMRGGLIEPICSSDWSASFERFADSIVVRTLVYPLSAVPYGDDVHVYFEDSSGTLVEQPEGTAWRYDTGENAIVLEEGFTPSPETTVLARYRATR